MSVLVCQITRGVAPARAIAEAALAAAQHHAEYRLVAGLPACEAKACAASAALKARADLVLVEDDILADEMIWRQVLAAETAAVLLATATCRNGSFNTRYDRRGDVLYSGTPLVRLPLAVLSRLDQPIFASRMFRLIEGELVPADEVPRRPGHYSDTHLWWRIRNLAPRPSVQVIGHVRHILHPLNRDRHDLVTPCELTVLP